MYENIVNFSPSHGGRTLCRRTNVFHSPPVVIFVGHDYNHVKNRPHLRTMFEGTHPTQTGRTIYEIVPCVILLQFVYIYILFPLPRTARKHFHLVVIMGRFSNMTQVAQIRMVNALNVSGAFFDNWMFPYRPPQYLLYDRASQFIYSLFQKECDLVGIRQ